VVLFGGSQNLGLAGTIRLNDTWEWDGQTWTSIATPHAPSRRGAARSAYDPARGRLLLHGGNDGSSNCDGGFQTYCTGTWEYDGRDWTMLTAVAPAPSRVNGQVAWSPDTGGLVLFGGSATSGSSGTFYGDYWGFDSAWTKLGPSFGASSAPWAACYDLSRRVLQTIASEYSGSTFREFGPPSTLSGGSPVAATIASDLFYDPSRRLTYSLGDLQTLYDLDGNAFYVPEMYVLDQRTPHARYAVHTFALDVPRGATLTSLQVQVVGHGAGATGNGVVVSIWNWSSRSWDVIGSNAAAPGDSTSAKPISGAPPSPAVQYLEAGGGRLWLMSQAPASDLDGFVESSVATDFVEVQASYTLP
jgi:hypothetical protein